MVVKVYRISELKSLVAVIGPKRMNYLKAITLVDFIADIVTFVFDKNRRKR